MLATAKRVLEYNYVFIGLVGTIDPTLSVEKPLPAMIRAAYSPF